MLDERKAAILRAVVEEYISTAQPVGSGRVARARGVEVSSATVRNEMVVLEQEGYLQQPHTSAGRIPTEKGYRQFVDHLGDSALDLGGAQQVRTFFDRAHGELEEMLSDTSRLLADLTSYAAVVVGAPTEQAIVRSVQLVALAPQVVLAVAVLANGTIEKHTIELSAAIDDEAVARASSHLASTLIGHTLVEHVALDGTGVVAIDSLVADALGAFQAAHRESGADQVYVGGASRVVAAFDAVDTVSQVLTILEQQLVVVSLLRDVLDRGLSVAIGSETGMEPLAACSLIVAPYEVDGEAAGTIGVLGPTRMDYSRALAAVALVSQDLGRRLTEG